MTVTQVQVQKQKVEFLLPITIPTPKYCIGQLVEVLTEKDYKNPDDKAWFPCRITGMAYLTYQGKNPRWEYQVQFLNSNSNEPFEWVHDDENIWLLEDY